MFIFSLLIFTACEPKSPPLDEGPENPFVRDPWNNDTFPQDDSASPEETEPDYPEPEPSEVSACYFGPDRDTTQCVPTVRHDPIWGDAYAYPEPYQNSEQYLEPIRFIDLEDVDPSLLVAPNFQLNELMSLEKGRFALFSPLVVETLQYIRDDLGGPLIVSSAYRNISYNAGVGGVTYSRHQYGDAVDLQTDMTDLDDLASLCDLYVASFISVYETHVHCDWRDDPLEEAFYSEEISSSQSQNHRLELYWTWNGWTTNQGPFDEGQPQRIWYAKDKDNQLIVKESGQYFSPPKNTQSLEVLIGGQVRLHTTW